MAAGLLEVYIGANVLAGAIFVIGGALLWRRHRLRGALTGLILGVLVGPLATSQLFFDAPEAGPIPDIVVGQ